MTGKLAEVVLYTKRDCHLCDDAGSLLESLAGPLGFRVRKVDIASDAELERGYRWAVPVVEYGGQELARAPIRLAMLEDALRDALAPH